MAINLLDQSTINKIAAGEVVDRPSSVVKELVENAIDAGANAVTVEIKDGGTSLIRITDNGCGIPKEDVKIAFLRHTTSKIKDAADLVTIGSLGFRGEALSSISAVAQVELITKTKESFTGIRYCIDGGVEKVFEEAGAPDGTTFLIRNLFYNTPARRKFLKTPSTEGGYISSIVEQLCMSHPELSFRFIVNQNPKIQTMGNGNLKDVIYTVYGREVTANLLEVTYQEEDFSIKGYIGKPVVARGNRNFENYYINGRYIKSGIISKAIEDAYAPFIMQHKYPFTALQITIKPELLDVNVHPSKMELRFSNGPALYDAVKNSVTEALTRKELIPEIQITDTRIKKTPPSVLTERTNVQPSLPKVSDQAKDQKVPPVIITKAPEVPAITIPDTTEAKPPEPTIYNTRMPEPFELKRATQYQETVRPVHYEQLEIFEKKEILKEENVKNIRIVGQVFDTYWIMEFDKNMYIVDQHAAHEKVLFETFWKNMLEGDIGTQLISPPVIFTVSLLEQALLKANLTEFTKLGFELEEFGGDEYAIRGVPAQFSLANPKDLLLEILDSLATDTRKVTPETIHNRIATMSCKAAVKGNNKLSFPEAERLLEELMTLDNPYHCPHGRPTMITMSQYELEKKFNRIV